MYRTHTCGELRCDHQGSIVTLAGWIQRKRELGGMTFIDLRDRYGITQLVFDDKTPVRILEIVKNTGREFVIQVSGIVRERSNKNQNIPTGDIEIEVQSVNILGASVTPPFTIEDDSDGGDDLRMKYRYLDLRRNPLRNNLVLRSKIAYETRAFLNQCQFIEIETPMLMRSTPEGARDFVVPSRLNQGEFYALPQSPQLFKQLLMVAGFDRYYQIVKCFRDEDLRADRQPEFTQIDCEMSFVEQEDVLQLFEEMTKHLFKTVKGVETSIFPRLTYKDAIEFYGSDKPDIRFDMKIGDLTALAKGKDFKVFNDAEFIGGICAKGCSEYSRKQLDELTEWVKRPQIGAQGMVYIRYNMDGSIKSSVDKFYSEGELKEMITSMDADMGDLVLILCGKKNTTLKALGELRLEMGNRLELRKKDVFAPLWVVDFPLLEWDDETQRYYAMHHPFTSPKPEDIPLLSSNPGEVRASAYDLVINGVEIGGGSVRIFESDLQSKMFDLLGFTKEEAQSQFGFLLDAFRYGAPPHAGIALGFDRLVSMFAGLDSIRDVIAFPKNNSGRDVMNEAPSPISAVQLKELCIELKKPEV